MSAPPTLPKKQAKGANQRRWMNSWLYALQQAEDSEEYRRRTFALMDDAAQRIEHRLSQSDADRPVIAWSGGKDSIAVEAVARRAGLTRAFIVLTHLEYPEFVSWVMGRKFQGAQSSVGLDLEVQWRDRFNWDWLDRHQHMMFPKNSQQGGKWFTAVQHAGQRDYAKHANTSLMLMGRRTVDGNYCGKPSASGGHEYRDRDGFIRYSPISDWSHEDVLATLAVSGLELPSVYYFPRGFTVATGPWAKRKVGSDEQGWAEVFSSDASIVKEAARRDFRGAREFLASRDDASAV